MIPTLHWLYHTPLATSIRQSESLFPWIESVHVLALTLVVGTILIVDFRLMGIASRQWRVSTMLREMLPITWGAFAVALMTGLLLFSSNAVKYFENGYFRTKMILLVAVFANMLIFHAVFQRGIARWDDARTTPPAARIAGLLSVALWLAIVFTGRWIGFTIGAN